MSLLSKLLGKKSKAIIIVSGLPRSGTSMMMKMLQAGGLEIVTDRLRAADDDNPQGYFELERVKRLADGDTAWLDEAQGKVIKVVSWLILSLPDTHTYKVFFMRRNMAEILASQRKMLERRGEDPNKVGDEEMARLFDKHLTQVYDWMDQRTNVQYIAVDYNQMLREPWPTIHKIKAFLATDLDLEKMVSVIDANLYRQRHGEG
ncbi:MAG: hypothetical protein JW726_02530 [Anaerolineales bacterium]|nr:hypothetical protein [Anaerolineales bacterium]